MAAKKYSFTSEKWYQQSQAFVNRRELAKACNQLGLAGNAVEIGVHKGEFAKQFLDLWRGERYVLVDPWAPIEGYDDEQIIPTDPVECEKVYKECWDLLEKHHHRLGVQRCLSLEAAKVYKDSGVKFDFVYIDADHDYDQVWNDLEAWYPLCNRGGIFAGHDFFNGKMEGPRRAVYEFLYVLYGYTPIIITGDAWSWYIIKR